MEKTTTAVDRPEEELRTWLEQQPVGTLRPIEVSVTRAQDADDRDAWFFRVVLPDPSEGQDTWPAEDIDNLQRKTRDRALELGLAWPWYVRFEPESDEPPEEPEVENRLA